MIRCLVFVIFAVNVHAGVGHEEPASASMPMHAIDAFTLTEQAYLAPSNAQRASVSWRLIATLTDATDFVGSVAFSPDGQSLASGSDDKKVYLYNITTKPPTLIETLTDATSVVALVG